MKDTVESSEPREKSKSFKAIIEWLGGVGLSPIRPLPGREAPPNSPVPSREAKTKRDEEPDQLYKACITSNFEELENLLNNGVSANKQIIREGSVYRKITPLIAAALSHEEDKEMLILRLLKAGADNINFIAYPKTQNNNHQPATLLDFVDKDTDLGEFLANKCDARTAEELLGKQEIASYSWSNS